MARQLDDLGEPAVRGDTGEPQADGLERPVVRGVDLVAVAVALVDDVVP